MSKFCKWHNCKNLATNYSEFCSIKCKNKFCVDQRRKDLKKLAVEYKGGKCYICQYNKCLGALDFHHLDPDGKERNYKKQRFSKTKLVVSRRSTGVGSFGG